MTNDTFRLEYKQPSPEVSAAIIDIKTKAQELHDYIENAAQQPDVDQRQIAVAKTNLEQAVMWAIKGLTA